MCRLLGLSHRSLQSILYGYNIPAGNKDGFQKTKPAEDYKDDNIHQDE